MRRDLVWPQATPPALPRDPFETPTSVWWQGSVPIEMQVVGVKFGWDL